MQSDFSEEELISRAQRGDREAFALLYESHVDRVYHYLLHRLSQPADAEDVTAEVFIRAMKALPSFKMRSAPFIAASGFAQNVILSVAKNLSYRV